MRRPVVAAWTLENIDVTVAGTGRILAAT